MVRYILVSQGQDISFRIRHGQDVSLNVKGYCCSILFEGSNRSGLISRLDLHNHDLLYVVLKNKHLKLLIPATKNPYGS